MRATVRTSIIFALFFSACAQETGARCKLKNGIDGNCEVIEKCRSAQQELKQGMVPTLCGFTGNMSIVCCNDTNNSRNERISEQKCREYLALYTPYEKSLIVGGGGVNAVLKEFPHMALLGYNNNEKKSVEYRCGGSLISDDFVLTAAHCLYSRDLGPVTVVRLGELDTAVDNDDAQNFKVAEKYYHPDYDFASFYNDIALLKLDRPVKFTTYAKPACLQTTNNFKEDRLSATGWGALYYGGGMHNILQKLELSSLPKENCLPTYAPQQKLRNGIDEQLQICGGNLRKKVDTCQGDSGGPLQLQIQYNPPVHKVVGVTSFGKHCNLVPGIYTRVSKYISWIESVVWPNNN